MPPSEREVENTAGLRANQSAQVSVREGGARRTTLNTQRAVDAYSRQTEQGMGDARCVTLTTREAFAEYVGRMNTTEVVAFEFTGAVLSQRLKREAMAVAIDRREPEHDGPCYRGDVWDVFGVRQWQRTYL